MNKKILYAAGGIVASVLLLRACRTESAIVMAQPSEPVAVQSPPVVINNSHDGFLTGLVAGHLMSGSTHHTTVVHHYAAPRRYFTARRSYSRPRVFRSRRR